MPKAMGWSMLTWRFRMPAHAEVKKSVLENKSTGNENTRLRYWKPFNRR